MDRNSIFDQNPHVQTDLIKESIYISGEKIIVIKMFINHYDAKYLIWLFFHFWVKSVIKDCSEMFNIQT